MKKRHLLLFLGFLLLNLSAIKAQITITVPPTVNHNKNVDIIATSGNTSAYVNSVGISGDGVELQSATYNTQKYTSTVKFTKTGKITIKLIVGTVGSSKPTEHTYEVHVMPLISGSSLVYNSGSTYTITDTHNDPVTWTCSSNIQLQSASGKSATFRSIGNGPGWIRIKIRGYNIEQDVWAGVPITNRVLGPATAGIRDYSQYYAEINPASQPTDYDWRLWPQNGNSIIVTGASCKLLVNVPGQYSIECRASNANGTGSYSGMNITVNNTKSYSYHYYPNPVSDRLTVKITPNLEGDNFARTNLIETYDIKLYNSNGIIVRSQRCNLDEQLEFDVSNLPNGNYFLHIYSGSDRVPEKQQIIIKH